MGGPLYVGTNCFHWKDILAGKSFNDESIFDWKTENDHRDTVENSIEGLKILAGCTFEINTEWGKERTWLFLFAHDLQEVLSLYFVPEFAKACIIVNKTKKTNT